MFKVGDKVRIKAGTVGFLHVPALTEGEVVTVNPTWGLTEVIFEPPYNALGVVACFTGGLEYVPPTLPVGNQQLFEAIDSGDVSFKNAFKSVKCDCGGLKVHGSLEPIFHSHWCSSQA